MDFKRKAYSMIQAWKQKKNRMPLIVEGLRQVGKSYIVNKFALENYEHVAVFDFRHNQKIRECFQGDLTVEEILGSASVYFPPNTFVPGHTVLIFEEIGDCDEARTSLKSFALDGGYDVIATGSLLGVDNYRKKKRLPIPTGYEEYLKMSSLDFEEFLWAFSTSEAAIDRLKKAAIGEASLPLPLQTYFLDMMKRYIAIGGMPDVIKSFQQSNSYASAREVQERLLHDFRGDFGRFVDTDGVETIDYHLQTQLNQVFDSIPMQLSRETGNCKFQFASVGRGARASTFKNAVDWLEKAGLVLKVYNTKAIEVPLTANADDSSYKLFLSDVGLLMACFPLSTLQSFLNDTLGSRKGAIYENLAAIMISKSGFPLFYYSDTKKHLEIDYLLETKGGIVLYEEKSTNGKMAASKAVMKGETPYRASQCIKVVQSGFGEGDFFLTIPQYASLFYLENERNKLEEGLIAKPVSQF